jgi:hypothetical protein
MAFYEEEKSWLEQQIGRRFPLAIALLIATCYAAAMGYSTLAEGLLVIDGIVFKGYYDAVTAEKQTIKMVSDE